MGYKNFAVVGAGNVGGSILENLTTKEGTSIIVITRPGSKNSLNFPKGVKTAAIEQTDVPALAAIFRQNNIEVVISTVSLPGIPNQPSIANAAKEAGTVKLFVPSEFMNPTGGHKEGIEGTKSDFDNYLKSISLPSARFYTGLLTEFLPWAVNLEEYGNFNIAGKGTGTATYTSLKDTGGFVAHVLTKLPTSQLEDAIFRISGQQASLLEVAALYGDKVKVVYVDGFPDEPFKTYLHNLFDAGGSSTGFDPVSGSEIPGAAGSANILWEGHRWQSIKDVLKL